MQSLFDVKGKVVLVTGGGRGVGEMVNDPLKYSSEGHDSPSRSLPATSQTEPRLAIWSPFQENTAENQVYISSRTAKACEETAARLTKEGPGECIAIPADLAKFEECERVVKELQKREEGKFSLSSDSEADD